MQRFAIVGCLGLALAQVLTGNVVDGATGEPLPGATVRIQGTDIGTLTDEQGRFKLPIGKSSPSF